MIKRNIFESPARMPPEGGVSSRSDSLALNGVGGGNASPLTVHSIMTPADSRAVCSAAYPRNNWLDVQNVRKGG